MLSSKEKLEKRKEQLRQQRLKGSGNGSGSDRNPPNKYKSRKNMKEKHAMKNDVLKEAPINNNQYIVLQSFISKFTPQKSDYDGVITHEVLPYVEDPGTNKKLRERIEYWSNYHNVDVHVALVGRWVPWNPRNNVENDSIIYKNEMLNETMIENLKSKDEHMEIFTDEVQRKVRKAYLESKMDAKKLDTMKKHRGEEHDGPITSEFWQDGDRAVIEEIMQDRKKINDEKKKLGINDKNIKIEKKTMIVKEKIEDDETDKNIVIYSDDEEEEY